MSRDPVREGGYRKGGGGGEGGKGKVGEGCVREGRKGGEGTPCVSLNFS